jgi:hypothetical protein
LGLIVSDLPSVPVYKYARTDELVATLAERVIAPAERKVKEMQRSIRHSLAQKPHDPEDSAQPITAPASKRRKATTKPQR